MKAWLLLLAMFTSTALLASPVTLRAQDPDAEEVIEQGREALGDRGGLPWYDSKTDDLRPLNLPPEKTGSFDGRNSRWETSPAPTKTTPAPTLPTFNLVGFFWTIMQGIFWALLVVLLALVVYLLVTAYIGRENSSAVVSFTTNSGDAEDDRERIESLPFVVARPRGDLLDEARAQYQAGNYRVAVIYLFSYLLIHLDKHQQIRLAKGKTNRQYLGELRPRPEIRSIVEQTMYSFEDVFFGDHSLTREEFEACWNQLDQFHRHVEQVAV